MADRFWVGGTGTWDATTTHWSTSTGGASGATAPTASDDVHIDANSGGGTISISSATCRSMDCTGAPATTISGAATITIGTTTVIAANIALKLVANITTGASTAYTFVSTSGTQQTVDFAGKTVAAVTFSGAGSSYLFSNGFTSGAFSHTAGTLDFNGKTFTTTTFGSTGATARSITYGAATHTCSSTYTLSGSNLTYSAASSTITCTATSSTFSGLSQAFGTVQFTGTTLGITSMTGANTFTNLKVQPSSGAKQDSISFDSNITVSGTFTVISTSRVFQIQVFSSVTGTARTISVGTSVSLTNADFMDITASGAAGTWSGTMLGDAGGNSNITFTTAQPQFWISGTGNQSDATHYSQSSGGANNGRIPLPQDNVTFDASSGAGTVTLDMPRWGANINMSASSVTTFTMSVFAILGHSMYGNITLLSSGTYNWNVDTVALRGRGAHTITSNGATIACSTFSLVMVSVGGSYTLQDALIVSGSGAFQVSQGTFNSNTQTMTVPTFVCTGSGTRTLTLTSSTINLSATAAVTVWNVTFTGVLTVTATSSVIVIQQASASARTFTGGGQTYGTLTYTVAGSTGSLTISDNNNTFSVINFSDVTNARSLIIGNSVTVFVGASGFNVVGTSGKLMTVNSVTGGTAHTISMPNGIVATDFLSLRDSQAVGGGAFWAGANSTNTSGNTGWVFTAQVIPKFASELVGMIG